MPKFAANLAYLFTEVPFLERFHEAARAGFSAVEVPFPYDYHPDELVGRLSTHSLQAVLINTPPGDWSKGDRGVASIPGREYEFNAGIITALRYAKAIGCCRVHVMAGVIGHTGAADSDRGEHGSDQHPGKDPDQQSSAIEDASGPARVKKRLRKVGGSSDAVPGALAVHAASVQQITADEIAADAGEGRHPPPGGVVANSLSELAALHRATFVKNLRFAAAEAAVHDVTLVIEPINPRDMPGYFLRSQAQAHAICTEIAAPNLKVQMDLYHAQIVEGDLITKIRAWLPHIGHIQIAGVPDRNEPDQGEVNYRYLFKLLDELRYDGWIGCEYKPAKGTHEGLRWMQTLVAN